MKLNLHSCLTALFLCGAACFAEEAKREAIPGAQGKIQLGPISVAVSVSSSSTDQPKKSAYLGVVTSALSPQLRAQLNLAEGMGLSVDAIAKDSPAEKAGLKQYDVLRKFNDQQLCAQEQLAVLVNAAGKGAKVTLGIIRGGKEQSLEATLGEHEGPPPGQVQFSVNGVSGLDLQDFEKHVGETVARAGLNGIYRALADHPPKEPASGGIHERWDERQKAMQQKQSEIQGRVAEEMKRAEEAVKKAGAARAQFFSVYPNPVEHRSNHKVVILTDENGTLELTEADGQRTVKIKNPSGQEVYSGPLNSAADHQALPEQFRAKAAQAEDHLKEAAALPPATKVKPQKQVAPEEAKKGGSI